MTSFEAKWNVLRASGSARDEAARIEDVTTFARKNQIRYQVAVSDATTGSMVPAGDLGRDPGARLRVQLTVEERGKKKVLTWEPRDPANVVPLLRE